eukprot:4844563-Amphidinium_carterae.1
MNRRRVFGSSALATGKPVVHGACVFVTIWRVHGEPEKRMMLLFYKSDLLFQLERPCNTLTLLDRVCPYFGKLRLSFLPSMVILANLAHEGNITHLDGLRSEQTLSIGNPKQQRHTLDNMDGGDCCSW